MRGARWEGGCPCPYRAVKCANCGGPHGGRADVCGAKREAWGEARGWWLPPPKRWEKGTGPEKPKERTTAAQEEKGEAEVTVPEEEGEAEVTVPEEEGAAQAAMAMEE